MRRSLTLLAAALVLAAGPLLVAPTSQAATVVDSGVLDSGTNGIALGPDGNYWVAQQFDSSLIRVAPNGAVVGSRIPLGGAPIDVVAGPDGYIWASLPGQAQLARVNPSSLAVTNIATGVGGSCGPYALANGGNGSIYFSAPGGNGCTSGDSIGSINTANLFVTPPTAGRGRVYDMVVSGGSLFASDYADNLVRRISLTAGLPVTSTVSLPAASGAGGITVADGVVWTALSFTNNLARFPATQINGAATVVTPTVPMADPFGIVPTGRGTVYVANRGNATVAEVASDGTATATALAAGAQPSVLVNTPDGVIATDQGRARLSRIADDAPTVGAVTATVQAPTVASVSVPVDTHGNATTVTVESEITHPYTVARTTLATLPGSAGGPTTVTGTVTNLQPGTSSTVRVRVTSSRGQATTADIVVTTPAIPVVTGRTTFKAKVGKTGTTLTKLTVTGLKGGESIRVTCTTKGKGCPIAKENYKKVKAGTLKLSGLFKGHVLKPGAKITVVVTSPGAVPAKLTLIVRDGKKPKATYA